MAFAGQHIELPPAPPSHSKTGPYRKDYRRAVAGFVPR
jgi:hypothetical protein